MLFFLRRSCNLLQAILNVRMYWSLPGTGSTLLILHHLSLHISHMMIPLIFHSSLILVEEDAVMLHPRCVSSNSFFFL